MSVSSGNRPSVDYSVAKGILLKADAQMWAKLQSDCDRASADALSGLNQALAGLDAALPR